MNQVVIEILNPAVLETLKILAQRHSRSLEDEIKAILEQVAEAEIVNKKAAFDQAWSKVDAARQGHGDKIFSDSVELLREDRNR